MNKYFLKKIAILGLILLFFSCAVQEKSMKSKLIKLDTMDVSSVKDDILQTKLMYLEINEYRSSIGLKPLEVNEDLHKAAKFYARRLAAKGELTHYLYETGVMDRVDLFTKDFMNVYEILSYQRNNYYTTIYDGWLKSKPHKFAIEQSGYSSMGGFVVKSITNVPYYIMLFGIAKKK